MPGARFFEVSINLLSISFKEQFMTEAVEKNSSVEDLDDLSTEEIEERARDSLERFKEKLRDYSE